MLEKKRTFFIIVFLLLFVFSGSAYALKFTGNAWVAQHLNAGEPTDEYYLVIDNSEVGNLKKVTLKGLKLKTASSVPNFYALTGNAGNEGLTYFEIDANSKYFKNLEKMAKKKSAKLIKKGRLTREDRQEWMDAWFNNRLQESLFTLAFRDDFGKKYGARIGFGTFENPVDYGDISYPPTGGGNGAAPVPEPTTMLLMGTGLLGLAAMRRRLR